MEKRKIVIRSIQLICAMTIGAIFSQPDWFKYWLAIPIVFFLGSIVYEYNWVVGEKHSRVKDQLKLLIRLLSFENVLDVRCTYHMPVRKKQLRQAFDYIPSGTGGGRQFSQNKGIIGKIFSDKGWDVENFQNDEEFRKEMIQKYSYTEEELQKRRADRRSYFCYSLVDENHKVIGLIYFDALKPNTFTRDETDPKTKMILSACEEIKNSLL